MKTYLFIYSGSLLLAMIFTPLAIFIARRLDFHDDPNARSVHADQVPRLGGVAIFLAAMLLTIPALLVNNTIGAAFRAQGARIIALLGCAAFMFLTGLTDDIWHLRARTKLAAQLAAAACVCYFGVRIDSVSVEGLFNIQFGWLVWPITILWIAGITNAVNFIDGLDGLAGGIAAIACGVIALLCVFTGQVIMAVFMLALLGGLTGFLLFNFNPARIFMGDSGSMFLGFTLATAAIVSATKSLTLVGLALPFLALGVPIFDMLFSMLRRTLQRRSMFAPDRSHIHHRLLDMGIHHRHVVLLIYAITLTVTALGMFMIVTRNFQTVTVFLCVTLLLVLAFRIVGAVRLRESLAQLKANFNISGRRRRQDRSFDNAVLLMRHPRDFGQWWQAACAAAGQLGLTWISISLQSRAGTKRTEIWRNSDHTPTDGDQLAIMTIPVPQRRADGFLQLQMAAPADSLELAGHRLKLFSRLVEEYSIAALAEESSQPSEIRGPIKQEVNQRIWIENSEIKNP